MKLKIKLITICAFILVGHSKAQEVKHQSEIIRSSVSKGDYKIIADQYQRHGGVMNITDIKEDKSQPNEHFELVLKEYPNSPTESTRNETIQLFPDNMAFPVTYVKSVYEGNAKLQEAVGYVVREGRSVGADRVVFVKDYLFILHQWQSKDDYQIRYVLKSPKGDESKPEQKTKKKKSFIKSLKSGIQVSQSGGSTAVIKKLKEEVLQPYLDNATKKQKTYYEEWIKKPNNLKTKEYIADVRVLMKKAMQKYNDDIFNSPEYQRMLAHRERMNAMEAETSKEQVTIKNESGKRVNIRVDGSGGSMNIESGSSGRFDCTKDIFYKFQSGNHTNLSDINTKIHSANSKCGGSITIN